ncbi:TonB-dependent receptor [Methylobacillus gramineus]|uniref:TonB-dependent receptor domain-containing protein n=1 Tax=Methylobacillus gramineus TaxID=755169 RepID=UPI001CFFA041|nr:TonB-dependent receptor [Methylobacillus gramineus]MCB5185512.1 TonB-dependent receptor [Methylobacillus gramineus]
MFRFSVGTIALASIFSTSITAQAADTRLEDTVVTASRAEQKVTDVIGDISIITEEQIQKAGQTTLVELLAMQPGIETSSNGGVGKSTNIYIRGTNPTHTLILVDGVRISSATTGETAIQHIPLSQIERVEILRGPASSMYGADAIGGVIQIFTKSGKGSPKFNASVGLGNYGTAIGEAGVNGRINNTSYSLQGGAVHVNGISTIKNKTNRAYNSDTDGYRNQNISAKITQHLSENDEIGLNVLVTDSRSFNDSGSTATTSRYDYFLDQTLSSYTVHSKNRFNQYWTSLLSFSKSTDDLSSFTKRPTSTSESTFKTTQDQYLWQNTLTTPIGLVNLGVERREQKADSNATTPLLVNERDIQSYFAGWQKRIDKHGFQVNLRNDDNSQFGNKTTGNAGYAYQITSTLKASASIGTAFAAPTFNQLYSPTSILQGITYLSNPNLKPEESRNKEIGLQYDNGRDFVSATYYHNEVDNLISRTGTRTLLQTINIDQAVLRGLTLNFRTSLAGFKLAANADFQRPENEANGNLLPRRAKEHGFISISKNFNAWDLGGEIQSSGARYNDAENTVRMSGYTLVNFYTNYRINDDWSLNARVNNLFDRKYELARDYGTYGTNLFVSLRFSPSM